jgi:hypothetical protein
MLVLFSVFANAQSMKYTITANQHPIGNLTVIKTQNNNSFKIEVKSDVQVHLFMKIDFTYNLVSIYKNDELITGSVTTFVNGKEHSASKVEKNGNYYSLTQKSHITEYPDKINYSGALLYFKEPVNVDKFFSEFSNIAKPMQLIGENEYQVTDPESGHKSEYIYRDGLLHRAVIHHTLMTFELTKI